MEGRALCGDCARKTKARKASRLPGLVLNWSCVRANESRSRTERGVGGWCLGTTTRAIGDREHDLPMLSPLPAGCQGSCCFPKEKRHTPLGFPNEPKTRRLARHAGADGPEDVERDGTAAWLRAGAPHRANQRRRAVDQRGHALSTAAPARAGRRDRLRVGRLREQPAGALLPHHTRRAEAVAGRSLTVVRR